MIIRRILPLVPLLLAAGCRDTIQHRLDERQANELQTVLLERGLDARKVAEAGKKPTWSIEVPDAQASDAVRILAELGLPREEPEAGCDVFGTGGLIRTPVEEQVCRLQVLERGLEKTLQALEGVLVARVHLVVPAPPRPGQAALPSKASVLLRVQPGQAAALRASRDALRALVAGGVEGLPVEGVSLMVDEVSTRVVPPAAREASPLRLRLLLAALAVAVSGLSVALVLLALRLRSLRGHAAGPVAAAPVPARPVVSGTASGRKVA
ncbi:flagellar M-ring protein FliF [Aggregicoccus sp. 17bor-14]|uniref:flagellar M-ring protein FliF n=1 Tax=Myxococcaceae TaxID=31 RepID=UPI00129CAB80|nr:MULTISPECIES: flagellar M-ring protein FliF [Myxococcaceae]MBF5044368.1 flagellar M-ring protein FliF [Simulacricoccus sp. 17bor-14]MRI90115.1 flagellar M-ring protein FliF [Aggregicoccus sp. 17bor-14]